MVAGSQSKRLMSDNMPPLELSYKCEREREMETESCVYGAVFLLDRAGHDAFAGFAETLRFICFLVF